MKKHYLLIAAVLILTVSCKKENLDPLIGKWEVIQRSPYSFEQTGSPAFNPDFLVEIKPGQYTLEFAANDAYISDNTTYINTKSAGTYSTKGNELKMIQETENGKPKPYIINYKFVSTQGAQELTLREVDNNGTVIAVMKLKRK